MSEKRKIKYLRLDQIKPWEDNPRVNAKTVAHVAQSIREFGFNQPIVVDQNGVVAVGNTRYFAASELGLKEVPVIQLEMTREVFLRYALADNRTHEYSDWDGKKLVTILEELSGETVDLSATGFDLKELTAMIAQPFHFDGDLIDPKKDAPTTRPSKGGGEIDVGNLGADLKHECPRCSFRF